MQSQAGNSHTNNADVSRHSDSASSFPDSTSNDSAAIALAAAQRNPRCTDTPCANRPETETPASQLPLQPNGYTQGPFFSTANTGNNSSTHAAGAVARSGGASPAADTQPPSSGVCTPAAGALANPSVPAATPAAAAPSFEAPAAPKEGAPYAITEAATAAAEPAFVCTPIDAPAAPPTAAASRAAEVALSVQEIPGEGGFVAAATSARMAAAAVADKADPRHVFTRLQKGDGGDSGDFGDSASAVPDFAATEAEAATSEAVAAAVHADAAADAAIASLRSLLEVPRSTPVASSTCLETAMQHRRQRPLWKLLLQQNSLLLQYMGLSLTAFLSGNRQQEQQLVHQHPHAFRQQVQPQERQAIAAASNAFAAACAHGPHAATAQQQDASSSSAARWAEEESQQGRLHSAEEQAPRLTSVEVAQGDSSEEVEEGEASSAAEGGGLAASHQLLYAVDRIVGARRTVAGDMKYKVRWVGYGAADDTWEPMQHLGSMQWGAAQRQQRYSRSFIRPEKQQTRDDAAALTGVASDFDAAVVSLICREE
ncbi:hypothetical protein cyc_02444 [Cyclospora cayetanensis]|uniref:Chromo domain-containing protein n=1 Tax=Cyclospora cayetanensis TaxID=88456 RepID=A0A1D3D8P3_9EIME|nr:hypothetical protein cyc_02444 [Cyclospora cayetanensis]